MLFDLYWSFFKVEKKKKLFEYSNFGFTDVKNHVISNKKHVFMVKEAILCFSLLKQIAWFSANSEKNFLSLYDL